MRLSASEKELATRLVRKQTSKARWRALMAIRDKYATRLGGEPGPFVPKARVLAYQTLMSLADGASDEDKAAWQVIAQREAIGIARRAESEV